MTPKTNPKSVLGQAFKKNYYEQLVVKIFYPFFSEIAGISSYENI